MRAANTYPGTFLLGIHFGKVGFLALVERRDSLPAIEALVDGTYHVEEKVRRSAPRLNATASCSTTGGAINDVVIAGGVRMIDVEVYIDGYYVNTYPGDGIVAGHTPWQHGVLHGGRRADPHRWSSGLRDRADIVSLTDSNAHFVAAKSARIELLLANKHEASLILDSHAVFDLQFGDVVRVNAPDPCFRLISLGNTNFYEAFRSKFNFRIRPNASSDSAPHRHLKRISSMPIAAGIQRIQSKRLVPRTRSDSVSGLFGNERR